jgi:hypothetical protein
MGFLKELQATMMRQPELPGARPADAQWAPIHGVDIDRYAWLHAQLQHGGFASAEESHQWLAAQGVAPGTWTEIHAGWNQRMARSLEVSTRYGMLASQHSLVRC